MADSWQYAEKDRAGMMEKDAGIEGNGREALLRSRCYALVDLGALEENILSAKQQLPAGCKFCAVVKADAYGHGAAALSAAMDALVDFYAVATLEEGQELRQHGITKPILDLGVMPEQAYREMLLSGITPSIFTVRQAERLSQMAGELGQCAAAHLALDTGMGRIGICTEEAGAVAEALRIGSFENLCLEGVFTHFASADMADKSFAKLQLQRFLSFVQKLEDGGLSIPLRHCANSAGIIEGIGTGLSMVRDGISLYGIYPSQEVSKDRLPLRPVLSWKSRVSHVKTVSAGTPISYGSTYVAEREMRVATVSIGYGDGLPRLLSNRASFLIRGQSCRILGRVCMDQCMVDASGIPVQTGDEVTVLGRDGDAVRTLYDWEAFGAFPYEVLCNIGKRVPRIYTDGHSGRMP